MKLYHRTHGHSVSACDPMAVGKHDVDSAIAIGQLPALRPRWSKSRLPGPAVRMFDLEQERHGGETVRVSYDAPTVRR